ncbi:EamA family transporter RarD [Macrococcoides caseolyticum]|uniref:EamA family transporter RarD n=1 Tax=Macrococcoides caseolyticum TaxID=69966 RepID=UPI001F23C184|nr:EamA family transporter RarD [Macrococcus caseolyticus]MCE4957289.1 EamA family transporter RarD [Macrococcus caseolyticus]
MQENTKGTLYAAGAYLLWGLLPTYWRSVDTFNPYEILFHRVLWSAVFMVILIIGLKKWPVFIADTKALFSRKKEAIALICASLVIMINWGIFIWAINHHHVLQASLGYYINPLMSIALGFIFMKERFNRLELFAIVAAAIGVLFMTLSSGTFPYISIVLAASFAIYGLMKKYVQIDAIYSIALETIITLPISLIGIGILTQQGEQHFGINTTSFLILFAGIATAVPLILFTAGAKRIPLSLIGFLQYISPTLILLQGIFLFGESFDMQDLITFVCIWLGLILYSYSKFVQFRKLKRLGEKY